MFFAILNIQAAGISKWSKHSNTLQGFQQQMKTRLRVQNRRGDLQLLHAWWESHYNVYRPCVSEPSADSHPKQVLQGGFREFLGRSRRERDFLHLKKHVQHEQAHVMFGDTVVVSTTVGTIKVLISSAHEKSSSAAGQTDNDTQLPQSTDTHEPGVKTGPIKRCKTTSPCTF